MKYSSYARNLPAVRSTSTLLPKEAVQAFRSLLQVDLQDASDRIPLNGCFQLMLKCDEKNAYVHADRSARWAALVYLSPLHSPRGGTLFFRHRHTGLTRYPEPEEFPKIATQLGISATELKRVLKVHRTERSEWIQTDEIEFRYNRFVLYDAKRFHRNGKTWGSSPQKGRLTHNFFV
jgi:hypothetical protein